MQISLIAAMANQRVIGNHNQLPWHLPADLKRFKALTLGKPVIMGRKTYESLGKPLPGRHNIIVSQREGFPVATGCSLVASPQAALAAAKDAAEVMVIGGAVLFAEFLPQADYLYLTQIHADIAGDTFFPAVDYRQWRLIEQTNYPADASHAYSMSFETWERGCER